MSSNNIRILFVDDEPNLLNAIRRQFSRKYKLDIALGAQEALEKLKNEEPFAIVVSDMRMPGMNGVEFLSHVKNEHPEIIRIMLTGNADLETAVHAVNEGNIFRFTTKPCPPERLEQILSAAIEQYNLQQAEKDLLEQTLKGAIRILVDTLALTNPVAFSRASRLRYLCGNIAKKLRLRSVWRYEIAAMLSQVGCVTVPPDILEKSYNGLEIPEEEEEILSSFPQTGYSLIANIPRLESVAEMIRDQTKDFQDTIEEGTNATQRTQAQIGADILRVATDFDSLLLQGKTHDLALYRIKGRLGTQYNPLIVKIMPDIPLPTFDKKTAGVKINELRTGMRLEEDVVTRKGLLLVQKGQEINATVKTLMGNYFRQHAIKDTYLVSIPKVKATS